MVVHSSKSFLRPSGTSIVKRPSAAVPSKGILQVTKSNSKLTVCKRPAAPDTNALHEDDNMSGAVNEDEESTLDARAKAVTASDRACFQRALTSNEVPMAILENWKQIGQLGYGVGKEQQKKLQIAAWRLQGWSHPMFKEVIEVQDGRKLQKTDRLLPWARWVVKFGGETPALKALRDGDLEAVNDPDDPTRVKYRAVDITHTHSRDIRHIR
jgi:hypothetical protein